MEKLGDSEVKVEWEPGSVQNYIYILFNPIALRTAKTPMEFLSFSVQ